MAIPRNGSLPRTFIRQTQPRIFQDRHANVRIPAGRVRSRLGNQPCRPHPGRAPDALMAIGDVCGSRTTAQCSRYPHCHRQAVDSRQSTQLHTATRDPRQECPADPPPLWDGSPERALDDAPSYEAIVRCIEHGNLAQHAALRRRIRREPAVRALVRRVSEDNLNHPYDAFSYGFWFQYAKHV